MKIDIYDILFKIALLITIFLMLLTSYNRGKMWDVQIDINKNLVTVIEKVQKEK